MVLFVRYCVKIDNFLSNVFMGDTEKIYMIAYPPGSNNGNPNEEKTTIYIGICMDFYKKLSNELTLTKCTLSPPKTRNLFIY